MTLQILNYEFLGPIRLSEWGPPMDEVLFLMLKRTKDTFEIIYAGELSTREKAFSPSSPLRFTWEYKIPWFYIENDWEQNLKAFIVVTDDISLRGLP
ncbi:MAG: hypothetical protein QXW91_04855, partial [Candidatus Nitrosotenuis sp.]